MKHQNALTLPEVYYGMHFEAGVCEYTGAEGTPYRVLISEETAKRMDATFPGRPVYLGHVGEVNLENLQTEADGYVVESFFNQVDGKHWAKFIVVSDRAKAAIREGQKLSNAYLPLAFGDGGRWHNVEYAKEITGGEFEHLAIVKDPRYEGSVILTPEAFKAYNAEKQTMLNRLLNSKPATKGKFINMKFWTKKKLENEIDEEVMVDLPTSKRQVSLKNALETADKYFNMSGYAADDHMVRTNNGELSVKDMTEKYNAMCDEKKANEAKAEEEKKANEAKAEEEKKNAAAEDEKKKENESEDEKKKENDDGSDDDSMDNEKEEEKKNFNALQNALPTAAKPEGEVYMTQADRAALGKSRYGSK